MQRSSIKRSLLVPLRVPGVAEALSGLTATHVSIFMLHRFSSPQEGVGGHDPATLRVVLSHLRKQRYGLLSVHEVFRRLREGEPMTRAVAFTIDDGYFDQASIGAPIFAEFDCPVTIFVTSGFLDGKTWMWWDQIQYICETTAMTQLRVHVGNEEGMFGLGSVRARLEAAHDISYLCQDASQSDRLSCIARMSQDAEVAIPAAPPQKFAPLSWHEARGLEKRGITFGPHTVTHPVLSSTSDDHAEFEITASWKRLCEELASPVPVFSYPHGRERDFGAREITTLQRQGLCGALAGHQGRLRPQEVRGAPAVYRVPRFPFSDDLLDVLQCVSGLEDIKARLRGALA